MGRDFIYTPSFIVLGEVMSVLPGNVEVVILKPHLIGNLKWNLDCGVRRGRCEPSSADSAQFFWSP